MLRDINSFSSVQEFKIYIDNLKKTVDSDIFSNLQPNAYKSVYDAEDDFSTVVAKKNQQGESPGTGAKQAEDEAQE